MGKKEEIGFQLEMNDGTILGVSKFPDRKQYCLYSGTNSRCNVLAYFSTEERVKEFERILCKFLKIEGGE